MKEPVFMDKLGFCQQLSMKSAVFMDKPDRRCVPATPASLLIPAAAGCSLQKPTGLLTEALTTPNRGWHVASNAPSVRLLYRDLQRVILPQRSKDFLHQTCSLRRRCI